MQEDDIDDLTEGGSSIIGGKGIVIHLLYGLLVKGTHEPMEEFRRRHAATIIEKRIKKVAKSAELTNKAERIAAAVSGERTAARPLLQGLINNSVDNSVKSNAWRRSSNQRKRDMKTP